MSIQDQIRGSLIGGAIGDALGYAIEFDTEYSIFKQYGKNGITNFKLDPKSKLAVVSDDTQMTLFTAYGLLKEYAQFKNAFLASHTLEVEEAYQDWLFTQKNYYNPLHNPSSRLLNIPELYAKRAPGMTCLTALSKVKQSHDFIKEPLNDSKGCGGIMRVAPVGLIYHPTEKLSIEDIILKAAYISAITHGHPLGYMPSAVVCFIINRLLYGKKQPLKEIVLDARECCLKVFSGFSHLDELIEIIDLAIQLSENDQCDLDNIHLIGEGWVAEETLGIALYCALKYQNDFSKAITTAVNHEGNSDSTGAVTGNLLGAMIPQQAMNSKWTSQLEMRDLIIEIADDLYMASLSENDFILEKYR